MQDILLLFVSFLGSSALGFLGVRCLVPKHRATTLAILNLGGVLGLCLVMALGAENRASVVRLGGVAWAAYLTVVLSAFLVLKARARLPSFVVLGWPIFLLVIFKGVGFVDIESARAKILLGSIVGFSYMAFRLTSMASEVINEVVPEPGLSEFLAYAFFLPTMMVGPISQYSVFRTSLLSEDLGETPIARALLRLLIGATKALYLAPIVNQLAYAALWLDGNPHVFADLMISAFSFHFYLYLNFSGYCDMAVGAGALAGVRVEENFNNPFASRNVREFWNRWHITLSVFMRNLVFAPLSKFLIRVLGTRNANHAIAIAIATVFVLVGLWHGLAWNFLLFGSLHALALVANHYYSIALRTYLGREGFRAYNEHRGVRFLAIVSTFLFITATLVLVANDIPTILRFPQILI